MDKKVLNKIWCSHKITFFPLLILFLLYFSISAAWSAEKPFPIKPINIIVNYGPGSVMDMHSKILGDKLSEVLGQPVLRVYKPGGGGSLGASLAAQAKPDGYTLFTGTSSSLVLTPVSKKVDYSLDDFTPLGIYARGAFFLAVKAESNWKTLKDFIEEAKKRGGQMKVSTPGRRTHGEFLIEALSKESGIKAIQVPYNSCGDAMTSLLGNHVDAYVCGSTLGQRESGTVRILAVQDSERSKVLPEVPTFQELGYNVVFPIWYSLCVSSKTPKNELDTLLKAMQEVYKQYTKEIQDGMLKLEFQPYFADSQTSLQLLRKDFDQISKAAKNLGIKPE
jgi:tripartite-type tricarboxylate transporter receptor subunit TctC